MYRSEKYQDGDLYVRQQWEDSFADHLSYKEKEEIHLYYNGWAHGYLWHIFSYNQEEIV